MKFIEKTYFSSEYKLILMKHILLNIAVISISAFISMGAAKAQTTILEQDGANDEFVVAEWTTSDPFSLVGTDKVNIQTNDQGILSISNSLAYKNIKVELHFSQTNTISFDLKIEGASANQTSSVTSDATGSPNKAVVSFNNTTAIALNKMTISNTSMTMGLIYLKITGVLDGTSSVMNENLNTFDVTVNQESLILNSEAEGTLNIYNNVGQLQSTHTISQGENTVMNSSKGLSFLVFTNSDNGMVSRKKILR